MAPFVAEIQRERKVVIGKVHPKVELRSPWPTVHSPHRTQKVTFAARLAAGPSVDAFGLTHYGLM
jgi:hypothetical protein